MTAQAVPEPRPGAFDVGEVALVHDWLTGMRGGENVLEALAELFPGAPIYTLLHIPGSVSPALEAHPIHTSFLQRAPFIERRYRHYLPLFPAAVEDFDLSPYRLVVSSSHCVAKGVIPPPGALHVCYCHTPMRYAWDQEHTYFPRRRGPTARLRNLLLTRLRAWDVASAARVDVFLANSRFVAQRIRRYYRREAEVLAPPVDTPFFTPADFTPADEAGEGGPGATTGAGKGELPEPAGSYALMVAALAPYKRPETAVEACRRAGIPLVIVGTGPEWDKLRKIADDRAPGGAPVHLLGKVDRRRLRALYRGAHCFLQPGIEDFGIAPVEALACGTPVVALGRGGVLDIVEDGVHGVLYDVPRGKRTKGAAAGDAAVPDIARHVESQHVDALHAEALHRAIDTRNKMRFNQLDLRHRAEEFSPERFARRFRSLLETWEACSKHGMLQTPNEGRPHERPGGLRP